VGNVNSEREKMDSVSIKHYKITKLRKKLTVWSSNSLENRINLTYVCEFKSSLSILAINLSLFISRKTNPPFFITMMKNLGTEGTFFRWEM
jgi:hypothetical protein